MGRELQEKEANGLKISRRDVSFQSLSSGVKEGPEKQPVGHCPVQGQGVGKEYRKVVGLLLNSGWMEVVCTITLFDPLNAIRA